MNIIRKVKNFIRRLVAAILKRERMPMPVDDLSLEVLSETLARNSKYGKEAILSALETFLTVHERALWERFILQSNQKMARLIERMYRKALQNPLENAIQAGESEHIPVVWITDDGYAVQTGVAITSLLCNKNPETSYAIYVLGRSLSDENTRMLTALSADVVVIPCDTSKIDAYNKTHPYVSEAALLKFDIPQILPQYNKVLYLDGDILVLGDLAELFATELGDHLAAVVKDLLAMRHDYHARTGVSSYFNSGVLLLNTRKMREENTSDQLTSNKAKDIWRILMDQDTFNVTFAENVVWLHPRYNLMYGNNRISGWSLNQMASFYGISAEEMLDTMNHPLIEHFCNRKKPWKTPLAEKYLDYHEYRVLFELLLEKQGFQAAPNA